MVPQVLTRLEATGGPSEVLDNKYGGDLCIENGFWYAVHSAFDSHIPLTLSPDHVWLAIVQQFAAYVAEVTKSSTGEQVFRQKFGLSFKGQGTLKVQRDDFVKGSAANPWPEVFADFSDQIAGFIGKKRDLLVPRFSTTGPLEKAVGDVILMDAVQKYFQFEVHTLCGIPKITLLGTEEDWTRLHVKAQALTEFGDDMARWMDSLYPVIDQFLNAAMGVPDIDWWKSFYHYHSSSGGGRIDGHFVNFFPKPGTGIVPKIMYPYMIPQTFSTVPFLWNYFAKNYDMKFVAGLAHATYLEDGSVSPAPFWAVGE